MIQLPDIKFETEEYAIGGQMITGRVILSEMQMMQIDQNPDMREYVRKSLATTLAETMLSNKLVEFTQHRDPISFSQAVVVRAYLAPDNQVKILRTIKR